MIISNADQQEETWVLILTVAGPNYRDTIVIEDANQEGLRPKLVDVGDFTYERYLGNKEGEFVEVRQDFIVARRVELRLVEPDAPELPAVDADIDRPLEERMQREET